MIGATPVQDHYCPRGFLREPKQNNDKTSFPRRGLSIEATSRRKNRYFRAKKAFPTVSAVTLPAAPDFRREKQAHIQSPSDLCCAAACCRFLLAITLVGRSP